MAMQQTVEINSVATALRELGPLIDSVQRSLQSYVDAGADADARELGDAAQLLAQIHGTLQLLDVHGGALLAAETGALITAVVEQRVTDRDTALERLLKAVMRLGDYVDRVRSGQHDAPPVLLPLLNELRATHGAEALTQRDVFFPDLSRAPAPAPRAEIDTDIPIADAARQIRPRFRRALLDWYRGGDAEGSLTLLGQCLGELAEASTTPSGQRLWGICGALTEALADQGLEVDSDVQRMMGRVERLLSRVSEQGEAALEQQLSVDLLRGLLYHVARSGSSGERVQAVRRAYDLGAALGQDEGATGFEGPDRNLLGVVADGIREDLAAVKDAVEIYVHSDERRDDALEGMPDQLARIADTFSMVGLHEAHATLREEAGVVADIGELDQRTAEQRLQALADTLLRLEGDLDDLLAGRERGQAEEGDPLAGLRSLPASEFRALLSATIGASLEDLAKVREALAAYCDSPDTGAEALAEAPALLDEVQGALTMLGLGEAERVLVELRHYIQGELVEGQQTPDDTTQVLIADVVAGLEYYLEAVDYDRAGMVHLLASAERAIEAMKAGGEPVRHADDETVVMASAPAEPDVGDEAAADEVQVDEMSADDGDGGVAEAATSAARARADDAEPPAGAAASGDGEGDDDVLASPADAEGGWLDGDDLEAESAAGVHGAAAADDEYVLASAAGDDSADEQFVLASSPEGGSGEADTTRDDGFGRDPLGEAADASATNWEGPDDATVDDALHTAADWSEPGPGAEEESPESVADYLEQELTDLSLELEVEPKPDQGADVSGGGGGAGDDAPATAPQPGAEYLLEPEAGDTGSDPASAAGDEGEPASDDPVVTREVPEQDVAYAEQVAPATGEVESGPAAGAPSSTGEMRQTGGGAATAQTAAANDGAEGGSNLAILGDDVDEEIVEVYIEEALGELDRINEHLPRWRQDPSNEESLITVRRAFHTLKGGGRLIGAELIGEFSWAMENMLNRVIDRSIDPGPAVQDTLDEGTTALPQLIEQLQGNRAPIDGIDDLIERAHALSRGEPDPPSGGGSPPGSGPLDRGSRDPSSSTPEPHGPEGPASSAADDWGGGSSNRERAQDGGADAAAAEDATVHWDGAHASALEPLGDADDSAQPDADEDTAAPLHGEAGVEPLSSEPPASDEPASAVDEAVSTTIQDTVAVGDHYAEHAGPHSADSVTEGDANAEVGRGSAAAVDEPDIDTPLTAADPDPVDADPDHFAAPGSAEASRDEVTEDTGGPTNSGALGDAEAAMAPVPEDDGDMDATLLNIFADEAAEHLAVVRDVLPVDPQRAGEQAPNDELLRALHTLTGSAQTAGVDAMVGLAAPMEQMVKARQDHGSDLKVEEVALLREGLDALDRIAEGLPAMDPPAGHDDLRARLEDANQRIAGDVAESGEDNELLEIFLDEADELVEACERSVQSWRDDPAATQRIMVDLQRNLHTLKGGARMAHIPPIADLTHEIESLVNAINDGDLAVDGEIFELLQEAVDALTVLLEQARSRKGVSRVDWLIDEVRSRRSRGGGGEAGDAPAATGTESTGGEPSAPDAEAGAAEPNEGPVEQPQSTARAEATPGSDQIRVQADLLDNLVNFAGEVSIYHSRLGEQFGQYKFNLSEFEQTVNRLREQLRDMENETESQILYRHEQEDHGPAREDFDPLEFDRYTRIQELSRSLAESVGDLDSIKEILENLTRDAETLLLQQSRVSSELQDGLMQTRMVRFDGLRARLSRTIRQTARSVGKRAEMLMSGGEIEVDRSIQERVLAPLEHVLRNAVSHGIEAPSARRAAGKPETGTVRIDLHRGGTDIIIDITDDGAGIDADDVRAKAIRQGLLAPDDERDDHEVIQLILETGFSTADSVTQVAGRGVGMDVVDAELRRLGGTLAIQTEVGVGTRFSIRLPVTLAINQAVLVGAGEETYAIPIASIEGVSQIPAGDLRDHYLDPASKVRYAGNEYELYHLGRLLGVGEPRFDQPDVHYPVVMIRAGDDRIALHVDQLVGRREVVVKPLGAPLNTLPGISGATIMADGDVVLILDVGGLLRTEGRQVETGGLSEAVAPEPEAEATAPVETAADVPTILIVDDSITIRKATHRVLDRNGLHVATAKDGVDAVSWMNHTVPDLILLDIEMPRMDGYEVASYVRNDSRLQNIPIIMITSRTGDKHRQRAEDIGVNRYLGKPYQEADLMAAIGELIRLPEAA